MHLGREGADQAAILKSPAVYCIAPDQILLRSLHLKLREALPAVTAQEPAAAGFALDCKVWFALNRTGLSGFAQS